MRPAPACRRPSRTSPRCSEMGRESVCRSRLPWWIVAALQNDGQACTALPPDRSPVDCAHPAGGKKLFPSMPRSTRGDGRRSGGDSVPKRPPTTSELSSFFGPCPYRHPGWKIGYPDGAALKIYVDANSGVAATLDPALVRFRPHRTWSRRFLARAFHWAVRQYAGICHQTRLWLPATESIPRRRTFDPNATVTTPAG